MFVAANQFQIQLDEKSKAEVGRPQRAADKNDNLSNGDDLALVRLSGRPKNSVAAQASGYVKAGYASSRNDRNGQNDFSAAHGLSR